MSPKIIKNRTDILQKVGSQTMLQLASILDPTWLHFGRVLAPNLVPTWPQDALKIHSQTQQKTNHILDCLWNDFWWILASKSGPFLVLFWWISGFFVALGAILGQDGAHAVQERLRDRFWMILGPNLVDFAPQLAGFWLDFGPVLSDFWCSSLVGWLVLCLAAWPLWFHAQRTISKEWVGRRWPPQASSIYILV